MYFIFVDDIADDADYIYMYILEIMLYPNIEFHRSNSNGLTSLLFIYGLYV